MTFEQFLNNNIFPIFSHLITWSGQVLNTLMSNFIFRIIVYISLIFLVIGVIKNIIGIVLFKTNKTQQDKGN